MKLTTISVAAAAMVVFAQSAQAREHYRHHRYHAAHFARHYSSPGRGDDAAQNMFADHGKAISAKITRAKIIQTKSIRSEAPTAAKSVPISADVRRRGAVGRCGSLCPAIRAPRSIWRATGRVGDRPDRPASARSWSGRTMSARSSARTAASGSSSPATTATGSAPGRARSPAPSPSAGDDRIARYRNVRDERARAARQTGRPLLVVHLVHGNHAAAPIAGGAGPFRIGAVVGDQLPPQRLGGERLAGDPGVVIAGRQFQRR